MFRRRVYALLGCMVLICVCERRASAQTLAWEGDGQNVANGYAVVLDGVRTNYGTAPFNAAGACACTVPLAISGGRHTVVVIAFNSSGESASAPFVIEPSANAGGPYAGQVGLGMAVNASASVAPTGSLVRYTWRWGDGTPDTVSTSAAASHTYFTGGTFPVTLTVTDNAGATSVASTSATVLAPSSLPWPWMTSDIGNVWRPGDVTYAAGGTFNVSAAGADIWGAADSFRYVYQPLAGDGRIVARVTGLGNTSDFAKAGVMMRESLNADAAHALLNVKPDGGLELLTRSRAGIDASYVTGGAQPTPSWLALTRSGDTVTASASADGLTWSTLGALTLAPTAFVGLAVTSHNEATLTTARFDAVTVTPGMTRPPGGSTAAPPDNEGSGPVPAPWQQRDVGITGRTGAATFALSGAYAVSGAGADIWDTSDAFHFVFQPFSRDGDVIARVTSLADTDPFAKAGLMLRSGLAPDAAHVILDVRPTGDIEFMTRTAAGEATRFVAGGGQSAPAWLKLTRAGSVVTAFISGDGSNWTTVGSTAVSFEAATDVVAGLAVTSHDPNALNTAIFDSVSVSPAVVRLPSPSAAGDIVIRANDIPPSALHGAWRKTTDPISPDGITLSTPDTGVSQQAVLAAPADYVDIAFAAPAGIAYRVWLRLRASANSKFNDSVWVQYSDDVANGSPLFRINTSSGLLVNLATDASAASLSGWGWHNGAYWLSQPSSVTFASGGVHTLRIQTREDGAEIDQIVLSPSTYFEAPPGPVSNDLTIVTR